MQPTPETAPTTAGGVAFRYGRFRYHLDEDRWEWSDELARLHGYSCAADVEPTAELMLAHKHPDDRARVAELIDRVRHAGESFSSQHRIVDRSGTVIPVIVIADSMRGPDGRRLGTFGFYVAAAAKTAGAPRAPLDVDQLVRRRATIERAKGALMLAYRIDDQQAFDLLVWRSQDSNVKVYALAAAIEQRLHEVDTGSRARTTIDRIVLTAHEDVSS